MSSLHCEWILIFKLFHPFPKITFSYTHTHIYAQNFPDMQYKQEKES